jgi:release factor glutamine methyltransferase
VRDFEPVNALDGGVDGLDFYRRFASEAAPFLKCAGSIMVEFGDRQGEAIRKIFESENWIVAAVLQDYTKRARILVAAKPDLAN